MDEYIRFFVKQVSDGIIKAWNSREPGSVTWGLSHAAIAYNRRAVYADGTAVMYGNTNSPDFLNLEGTEDHDVNSLFFWNKSGKLTAMAINVPCPVSYTHLDVYKRQVYFGVERFSGNNTILQAA